MPNNAKIEDLQENPQNTNSGSERGSFMIRSSIENVGAGRSGVCDADGVMLCGNQTLEQMAALGIKPKIVETDGNEWVIVKRTDLKFTEPKAQELAIADNRTSQVSYTPNVARIISQAQCGANISPYFSANEIKVMVANALKLENEKKMEQANSCNLTDAGTVKFGDVWQIGEHRIVCGDNQDPDSWVKLLGHNNRAAVVVTSPPYAEQRKYDKDSAFKPIPASEYCKWYEPLLLLIQSHLEDDGSYFMNIKPHIKDGAMTTYVLDLVNLHCSHNWIWKDEFTWTHPGSPKKVTFNFKNQWEPIYQFCKHREIKINPEAVASTSDKVPQKGGKNTAAQAGKNSAMKRVELGEGLSLPGNVLKGKMSRMQTGHPATYPLYVPNFFIRAYSNENEIIVDPFCGSGTTLVAAEINKRAGRGIEISPHYCGLIISWLEQMTGAKPILL